jgi:L-alanine-DL-glutamate epimerase-like enolase superfamily enzyme
MNRPSSVRIVRIECLQIEARERNPGELDPSSHTAVIRITSEDGTSGIGETDAPPALVAAMLSMPSLHPLSMGIRDLLIGENPLEIDRLWEKCYEGTIYHGRRGLVISLLSAIDLALHDLRGKLLNAPVYQLVGGVARSCITPYATLFAGMPDQRSLSDLLECSRRLLDRALEKNFRAVKMETLFGDLMTDLQLVEFVHECRRRVGESCALMIDVGYRWTDVDAATSTLRSLEDAQLLFVETPLHTDDLEGLARVADATETPVACGEFLQTRFEFLELIDRGHCDVIQPDLGRVGGMTEALRCTKLAADRGVHCVPHAWKTGLSVAATRHFSAAVSNCPYTEYFDPDLFPSWLRANLAGPEPELRDGYWSLPESPGFGVELDEDALRRCLVAPVTVIE